MNIKYTSLLSLVFMITVINLQAMETNPGWVRVGKDKKRTLYKLSEASVQEIGKPTPQQIKNSQKKANEYLDIITLLYGLGERENA